VGETENDFPETDVHPLLHFHILCSVFLSCHLTLVVNGAQLIIFIVVVIGLLPEQRHRVHCGLELPSKSGEPWSPLRGKEQA